MLRFETSLYRGLFDERTLSRQSFCFLVEDFALVHMAPETSWGQRSGCAILRESLIATLGQPTL